MVNETHTNPPKQKKANLKEVSIQGEPFLKISNNNSLRPFFMSLVSDSNHWMFVSSNGGLTAGRRNAAYALFPYYTDDKITESAEFTGSKTIFKIKNNNATQFWEPFSNRFTEQYKLTRNVYKNIYGDKLIFEEINHSLQLKFSYQWSTSDQFGFIKTSKLKNLGSKKVELEVVDGLQNILPASVDTDLQTQSSNLVDAYKRSEIDSSTGLGIFALSAIPVDKAEPSEALKANVVWSIGVKNPLHLLSSTQLENFRNGIKLNSEDDVKAEKGAYFINTHILLEPEQKQTWQFIADVNYNQSAVVKLQQQLQQEENLKALIQEDVNLGTENLIQLVGSADGIQQTNDNLRDIRHFSNSMFNIMRGGIFDQNYTIERWDFIRYLKTANVQLAQQFKSEVGQLPEKFSLIELKSFAQEKNNPDFLRIATEYLPLKFSRRHGDPSRPWNKFSINTKDENGNKILDYEGNWRDIFQNWESLAHSYPAFIESMIFKFLNATTFDGYNPYRVTKDGFDWETIEPDDPWSYIGYWGDHQIIYLLKFLEFYEDYKPHSLATLFKQNIFVYANVPYVIKPYDEIVSDPKDTIAFNSDADAKIRNKREQIGADGALLEDQQGKLIHVNFIEKVLATSLAKLANLVPEAGIWMNTQRPEWNDANNALVGNGASMVTLSYLRRFLNFFKGIFNHIDSTETYEISEELAEMFTSMKQAFEKFQKYTETNFSAEQRKVFLDEVGSAASNYRTAIYTTGHSGVKTSIKLTDVNQFTQTALSYLEHSIDVNKRTDNLYHAYNLISIENNQIQIDYLDEMLEGQVAVLSAGYLRPEAALQLLDALKNSALFRADQYSYLLYPYKNLKGFLQRNQVSEEAIKSSNLLSLLIEEENTEIIQKDVIGNYHFNSNFNNSKKLKEALLQLEAEEHHTLVKKELDAILNIYEKVFNHKAFTGRSGTFYGYEGLGSIYWHMVSKLQLAVLEVCQEAIQQNASAEIIGRLLEHYYEINAGIGVHKSPELYGAFPTDPYSHTPFGKGAQQPGMTGQVKEDVLSRFGELGIEITDAKLQFKPHLLKKEEFLQAPKSVFYYDVHQQKQEISVKPNSIFFTFCQVPIIYTMAAKNQIEVVYKNGKKEAINSSELTKKISMHVFKRTGEIHQIHVSVSESILK